MLEFSNLIQVTPTGSDKFNPDKVYEFVADPFSYIPQLTDNEANLVIKCKMLTDPLL